MQSLIVPIKSLDDELTLPAYAHEGDAGLDLCAAEDAELPPFQRKTIPCGFAIAIPHGYGGFVLPRSGLAAKHGISIVNAPGLIDSNYRGEVKVILVNLDPSETFSVKRGDRIAQLALLPIPSVTLSPTDDLDDTVRGSRGFGSSGIGTCDGAASAQDDLLH